MLFVFIIFGSFIRTSIGFATYFASNRNCAKHLSAGTPMMGNNVIAGNTRKIVIMRGSEYLVSGSQFIGEETLSISLSPTDTQFAFEILTGDAIFVDGACENKRIANVVATIKMPVNGGDVQLVAGSASTHGVVTLTDVFVLKSTTTTLVPIGDSSVNQLPDDSNTIGFATVIPTLDVITTTVGLIESVVPSGVPTYQPSTLPILPSSQPSISLTEYPSSSPSYATPLHNISTSLNVIITQQVFNISVNEFDKVEVQDAFIQSMLHTISEFTSQLNALRLVNYSGVSQTDKTKNITLIYEAVYDNTESVSPSQFRQTLYNELRQAFNDGVFQEYLLDYIDSVPQLAYVASSSLVSVTLQGDGVNHNTSTSISTSTPIESVTISPTAGMPSNSPTHIPSVLSTQPSAVVVTTTDTPSVGIVLVLTPTPSLLRTVVPVIPPTLSPVKSTPKIAPTALPLRTLIPSSQPQSQTAESAYSDTIQPTTSGANNSNVVDSAVTASQNNRNNEVLNAFMQKQVQRKLTIGLIGGVMSIVILLYLVRYYLHNYQRMWQYNGTFYVAITAVVFAIISIVLVNLWTRDSLFDTYDTHFLGRPHWHSNMFAYHPLFMIAGVLCTQIISINIWSILRSRRIAKVIHIIVHTTGIVCLVLGLYAVVKVNLQYKIPALNTLHSWLGIATVVVFTCNYLLGWSMGVLTTCYPQSILRKAFDCKRIHRYCGLCTLSLTVCTVLTGIMDKLPQGSCSYPLPANTQYNGDLDPSDHFTQLPLSCRIVYGLGLTTLFSVILTVLGVALRNDPYIPPVLRTSHSSLMLAMENVSIDDSGGRQDNRFDSGNNTSGDGVSDSVNNSMHNRLGGGGKLLQLNTV